MGPKKRDIEGYHSWCVEHFSGIVCIDEVGDGSQAILFATDPLNDFTIAWKVTSRNDQVSMDAFLEQLKIWGIVPEVAITDGSPLYKEALKEHWKGIAHQLCIFHVIKDVNRLMLDGVRDLKNRLKRLGNRGRKRRRGRPGKEERKKSNKRTSRREQAKFIWEHQHLIVKKSENLSEEDKETLKSIFEIAPELELFRRFNEEFYSLFEKGLMKEEARRRRERMVNNRDYQSNSYLAKALRMLSEEKFEKMITFMDYENCERTNNHVERNNRGFRLMQKTRYKRRRSRTIETAIWLDVLRRWRKHPLHDKPGGVKLRILLTMTGSYEEKEVA